MILSNCNQKKKMIPISFRFINKFKYLESTKVVYKSEKYFLLLLEMFLYCMFGWPDFSTTLCLYFFSLDLLLTDFLFSSISISSESEYGTPISLDHGGWIDLDILDAIAMGGMSFGNPYKIHEQNFRFFCPVKL